MFGYFTRYIFILNRNLIKPINNIFKTYIPQYTLFNQNNIFLNTLFV